jgi:predicted DNA-binding transcriptional regulator YafY
MASPLLPAVRWAVQVFSPEAARWVRFEMWHEGQKTRELPEGRFELKVPNAYPRALEMDILRRGENVEVVESAALRESIVWRLACAASAYRLAATLRSASR